MRVGSKVMMATYQQPFRLRFFGSGPPGFFGRGMEMMGAAAAGHERAPQKEVGRSVDGELRFGPRLAS